ncbi:MAG: zf-HC2 domain-containing protein [Phycisphaerales bacterium]|nr:zf-HC2 domain-containing protein [Phycisphaerales bacterium]
MICNDVQNSLADYLGGELPAAERDHLDDHLRDCPACRREVDSLHNTLAAMNRLDAPPAPIAFPRRRRSVVTPFAYAAVLLFGIGLGWMLKPTDDRSPSNPIAGVGSIRLVSAGGVDAEWLKSFDAQQARPFTRNLAAFARGLSAGPVQ